MWCHSIAGCEKAISIAETVLAGMNALHKLLSTGTRPSDTYPGLWCGVVAAVDLLQVRQRLFVVLHLLVRLRPPHQRPGVARVQLQRRAALIYGILVPAAQSDPGVMLNAGMT